MYENKLACGICGGEVSLDMEGVNGVCLGCGNTAMYPKSDVKRLNRITYLRNNFYFEKAAAYAAELIEENPEDSEAYWAMLLCRYGISYVRTGSTRRPVCRINPIGLPPVKDDENYKRALYYATEDTQQNYENLANEIDECVLAAQGAVENAKEYSVFVLSRLDETADNDLEGEKLYIRFSENLNFDVFYIPESLKEADEVDKAALISAAISKSKILIADFRTAEECGDSFMNYVVRTFCEEAAKEGSDKLFFPVFNAHTMSFQQLPEKLLWSDDIFDTSDDEFMREISDKVESILKPEEAAVVPDAIVTATAANKENLVKRAYMFLEDGEFETANTYFDKILDIDIEDSRAYIGKLLAECKLKSEDEIPNLPQTITNDKNYIKALRFATPEQKARYEALNGAIVDRIEGEKKRIAEEHERLKAEREEKEAIERQRRERQAKEERKLQYQRRREPLRKTLLEVRAELNKTFITPKRKAELKEQEEVLQKNIKELDMLFPDVWD